MPVEGLTLQTGTDELTANRIATLYRRAPLLRPVQDEAQIQKMFDNASFVISAWHNERLVGIARVLSDGVLFSYLCDLAVEPDLQRLGIGRAIMEEVIERCEGTELIVRDASASQAFYERLGFSPVGDAWSYQT